MEKSNQNKKSETITLPQQQPQQPSSEEQESLSKEIQESGSITPLGGKHRIHCLTVVGQIEGHYVLPPQTKSTKYEHVIPQLIEVEQDPRIEGLLMILNTVGGDVEAGLAISELVSGMKKPTVSLVLGGGHSIGVPLACSAKRSFIVPSATMTIHPVRMNGTVLGVPQTLAYFERMQDRIIRFVEKNSRLAPERFHELMMNTCELIMDVGTVLNGEDAVKEGLIDHLGGLSDAIRCLYELIEAQDTQSAPPQVPHRKTERAKTSAPRRSTGKKATEKAERPLKKS